MKEKFARLGLASLPYRLLKKKAVIRDLDGFEVPVVIKTVDSQGQRGIFLCKSAAEVLAHIDEVLVYSRENYILVERYYPQEEETLNGWVENGVVQILSITDRVTFDEDEQLGICLAHSFPSKFRASHGRELITLAHEIVEGFDIMDGPIYFQFLIGEEGVKINEIACRIGGAYESVYLPKITGFDLCKAVVEKTMGLGVDVTPLKHYDFMTTQAYRSVQLFFAEACEVVSRPKIEEILAIEGVIDCQIHYNVGDVIGTIENATARAGYVIVEGKSKAELTERLTTLYERMVLIGKDQKNHIIHETFNENQSVMDGL